MEADLQRHGLCPHAVHRPAFKRVSYFFRHAGEPPNGSQFGRLHMGQKSYERVPFSLIPLGFLAFFMIGISIR